MNKVNSRRRRPSSTSTTTDWLLVFCLPTLTMMLGIVCGALLEYRGWIPFLWR